MESFKAANLTVFIVNNASNANFDPNVVNNAGTMPYFGGIADREETHMLPSMIDDWLISRGIWVRKQFNRHDSTGGTGWNF